MNIRGMNIDIHNPGAHPNVNALGEMGYVRVLYNVSQGTGSTDLGRAFNQYRPALDPYFNAGKKVIFIVNHQTRGRGKNQWSDEGKWMPPESPRWEQFAPQFADFIGQIASQWQGFADRIIWQIWNEQDSLGGIAAVRLSSTNYGVLFGQTALGN